ncbi:MAG TPA: DnaJ family domain-containing protein [Anaerolineales bacterium]|nr:DnaJ family domain-containing protein [Anaerolineales bacterium]
MSNIEEHIRKAIEEGKFDNLPGKGKPLRLDNNPHEDPDWRLAHHILREGGFSLPWIETLREIEADFEDACAVLVRTWAWRQDAVAGLHQPPAQVEWEWRRAKEAFYERIAAINKRISSYNLEVPITRFQKLPLSADREIARLTASDLSDRL